MSADVPMDVHDLQQRLGVEFRDARNLRAAFVHESYVHEYPLESSNERLEFLGDAVLGLATSEMLYESFPHLPEGELTRMKAMIVSRVSLAGHARQLRLGEALLLSRGGEASGERERNSLLADVFEAVVGALFLDSGWEAVRAFIRSRFLGLLAELPQTDSNFKSLLQQQTQKHFKSLPIYRVVREKGPPHSKTFSVEVHFRGEILGRGSGRSKKEAQQEAAREALQGVNALLERATSARGAGQGSEAVAGDLQDAAWSDSESGTERS